MKRSSDVIEERLRHRPRLVSAIFLGDLAAALNDLAPEDDDTRAAIAGLLGFTVDPAQLAQRTDGEVDAPVVAAATPEQPWRRFLAGPSQKGPIGPDPEAPPVPLQPTAGRLGGSFRERLSKWRPLPRSRRGRTEQGTSVFDLDLFPRRLARSIISLGLAVRVEDGEPDIGALVAALTFVRPMPRRIPRLPSATLRFGVQVVLDRREAMRPFFRDQNALVTTVRAVVGHDRVGVVTFDQSPDRVLDGSPMRNELYCPLSRGTPVLLVSDLGIGCASWSGVVPCPEAWTAFATRVRSAGCPLVAFVPYPRRRWPADLPPHIKPLHWDRGTSVATVRRLVGIGHDRR